MMTWVIILIIAVIAASLLFVLLKKVVKLALFLGLFLIVFLFIATYVFPEEDVIQKGKNYILGKSEYALDQGKDKITAYVITETNETISIAKQKTAELFD